MADCFVNEKLQACACREILNKEHHEEETFSQ
jgi:hypothetical protein